MDRRKPSRERVMMQMTLGIIAVLLLLCLLALGFFAIARVALPDDTPDPSARVPEQNHSDVPDPAQTTTPPNEGTEQEDDPPTVAAVLLTQTPDRGQAYIDSMVFFGESTTAHLRSRGVLSGGTATNQVWADASNTMMLSPEILRKTILYPETGESLTIEQAAEKKKPAYIVLAFGVNGLSGFVANERLYAVSYGKLIGAIHAVSPQTKVILQTVYPVGSAYDDAAEINRKIRQLNEWLPQIAAENGAYLVDTASVLADEAGMLRPEFAQADGLHLTAAAYHEILLYLRTHGCP